MPLRHCSSISASKPSPAASTAPLDGYGALPLVLPAKALEAYQDFSRQPMIGWVGILIAWKIFGYLYHPIFLFAVNLLYPGAQYG